MYVKYCGIDCLVIDSFFSTWHNDTWMMVHYGGPVWVLSRDLV